MQQLRYDERYTVVKSCIENRADIGMVQGRCRTRLPLESGNTIGLGCRLRREHLHGNLTTQTRIPRLVHLSHPPDRNEGKDFVRAETRAGRQCHPRRGLYARGSLTSV